MKDLRFGDPREQKEVRMTQRQFTVEIRVDYHDDQKNEEMRKALLRAARNLYATASLLKDTVQPEVAIFSDDFYHGHQELKLMDDVIAQGETLVGGEHDDEPDNAPSLEMLNALRGD